MPASESVRSSDPSRGPAAVVAEAVCLSLAVLVPLHFNPLSTHVFENHKAGLLLAGAIAIAAAWAVGPRGGPRRRSRLHLAVALFVATDVATTLLSVDPWLSLRGTVERQQGLLTLLAYVAIYLAVVRWLRRPDQRRRLVTALIVASVPVCLYGLVQQLGVDPVSWRAANPTRIASTLGNPIFLGAWLAMILFPTLGRAMDALREPRAGAAWRGAGYGSLVLLQVLTLLATRSRGPLLAAVVAGLVYAACVARMGRVGARSTRRLSGAAALLLVAGIAVVAILPASAPAHAAGGPSSMIADLWQDVRTTALRRHTVLERFEYWRGYLDAYLAREPVRHAGAAPGEPGGVDGFRVLRPWIGHGPDAAGDVLQQRVSPSLSRTYGPNVTADRAHNEVWDRLVAGGVLGLVVWTWLLVELLQRGLSAAGFVMDRCRRLRFVRVTVGCAVAAGALSVVWPGPSFFGLGFQTGLCAGVLVYAAFGGVRAIGRAPSFETWGLLAALLAHVAETSVGIGVTSTRLAFWLIAGMLVVAARPGRPSRAAACARSPVPVLVGAAVGLLLFALLPDEPVVRMGTHGSPVYSVSTLPVPVGPAASAALYAGAGALLWLGTLAWLRRESCRFETVRAWAAGLSLSLVAALYLAGHHAWLLARAVEAGEPSLAELHRAVVAVAELETLRVVGLYVWWVAVAVMLSVSLHGRALRWPRGSRAIVSLVVVSAIAVGAIWHGSVRPSRADVLNRSGMRWRVAAASAEEWPLRIATTLLLRAALERPGCADYWFNFSEAATASALAATGPGSTSTAVDLPRLTRDHVGQIAHAGRETLLVLALAGNDAARAAGRASPLVPLNRAYVHRRWLLASRAADVRDQHRRAAAACLGEAERMFGPGWSFAGPTVARRSP